ncbi:MAG: hypothetical protein LBU34_08580 [Planctomycetaceae bacterium]|nr:hypothetical protein [Planctomycetaceae bacterium]
MTAIREKIGKSDRIVLYSNNFWRICVFLKHLDRKNAAITIFQSVIGILQFVDEDTLPSDTFPAECQFCSTKVLKNQECNYSVV